MEKNNYTIVFDYALVELFGHNRIVGQVGEQEIGGETFLRVDVPPIDDQPGFTKLYGKGAIYGITPLGEATFEAALHSLKPRPFQAYELDLPSSRALPRSLDLGDEDANDD